MIELIAKIEQAIDDHADLTRMRARMDVVEEAELCYGRTGWTARILARNARGKGRGARSMHQIWADGETPEAAADALIAVLSTWAEALK